MCDSEPRLARRGTFESVGRQGHQRMLSHSSLPGHWCQRECMRNLDSLKRNIGAPSAFAHRIATKLNTIWLRAVYPFNTFGDRVSVDYSCDIAWAGAGLVNLHHGVCLGRDVWLNVEGSQMARNGTRSYWARTAR